MHSDVLDHRLVEPHPVIHASVGARQLTQRARNATPDLVTQAHQPVVGNDVATPSQEQAHHHGHTTYEQPQRPAPNHDDEV